MMKDKIASVLQLSANIERMSNNIGVLSFCYSILCLSEQSDEWELRTEENSEGNVMENMFLFKSALFLYSDEKRNMLKQSFKGDYAQILSSLVYILHIYYIQDEGRCSVFYVFRVSALTELHEGIRLLVVQHRVYSIITCFCFVT